MTARPSRRAFLGCAGISTLALAAPAVAISTERPWDAAKARYLSAVEACQRYRATSYDPAWDRVDAAVGVKPPSYIRLNREFGSPLEMSVAPGSVFPDFPAYDEARRATLANEDWWARRALAERSYQPIFDEADRLWKIEDEACAALMSEAAPDGAALAFKMLLVLDGDAMLDDYRDALKADATGLAETS